MTDRINLNNNLRNQQRTTSNHLQDKAQENMELRNVLFSKNKDIKKSKISKLER